MLLVDKPAGLTSHDVVAIVRRFARQRRVGHAGTLDPFATGLLVVLLGRTTRLLPYLAGEPKVYDAVITFGHETDTDDATGTPTCSAPPPARADIDAALAALTGALLQVPPAYSAKQRDGQRAYAAARRGAPLALPPAPVAVHAWDVTAWDGALGATVTCSGGTYVRALARDLGRAAHSAAHLASLRRRQSGPFRVDVAATLPMLEERGVEAFVRPALDCLADLVIEPLDGAAIERVRRGQSVGAVAPGDRAALVDRERRLVAVAVRQGEAWQPRVVMGDDDDAE